MFVLRHADGTKRAAQSGAAQMPRRAALSRVERPEISSAFLQRHARRDGASARGEGGTGGAAGAVANDADAAREVRVLEDANLAAIHAGRAVVATSDIQFARRLRGDRC